MFCRPPALVWGPLYEILISTWIPGWLADSRLARMPLTSFYRLFRMSSYPAAWIKSSDKKRSVFPPPKYTTKSQFRLIYTVCTACAQIKTSDKAGSLVEPKEVTWLICSNQLAPWSSRKKSHDWFVPISWLPGRGKRGHMTDLFQSAGSLVKPKEVYEWAEEYL